MIQLLGWVLATRLQAEIVYTMTPTTPSPLSCGISAAPLSVPVTQVSILPGDLDDPLFRQKRWPCILKGAQWSQQQAQRPLPAPAQELIPRLKNVFASEGLPGELAWGAEVESTLNTNALSRSGALGLFQFKAAAARRFNLLRDSGDYRTEPEHSARAAARYLAHLHSRFGDWMLAVAAYNAGEGCVERLLKTHKTRDYLAIAPYLPPQNQVYVIKIMTTLALRENTQVSALPAPQSARATLAD